jgi:hypothetical protein
MFEYNQKIDVSFYYHNEAIFDEVKEFVETIFDLSDNLFWSMENGEKLSPRFIEQLKELLDYFENTKYVLTPLIK